MTTLPRNDLVVVHRVVDRDSPARVVVIVVAATPTGASRPPTTTATAADDHVAVIPHGDGVIERHPHLADGGRVEEEVIAAVRERHAERRRARRHRKQ
jgi:hypothetical protein